MSSFVCLSVFLSLCVYVYSDRNTQPISFGIITNNDFHQPFITTTIITLYWHQSSYQCTIQPSEPNHFYQCDIKDTKTEHIINDINNPNTLQLSSSNDISIKSIQVLDDNNNYHEINRFCDINTNNCKDSVLTSSVTVQFPAYSAKYTKTGFIQHTQRRLAVTIGTDPKDIDYFNIKLSSLNGSGTESNALKATVFWGKYSFQCNYTNPIHPGDIISCYPSNVATIAGPGNGNVSDEDSYRVSLDYSVNNNRDLIRIDSIRVFTNDFSFYEIDQFCVPKEFSSSNTVIDGSKCTEYGHKYESDVIELDYYYVNALDILFMDGIPINYSNTAQFGNVIPPEPLGFTIYLSEGAVSNSNAIKYILFWDEYVYHCSDKNSSQLIIDCDIMTISQVQHCEFQSKYKIEIINPGKDIEDEEVSESPISIDAITVNLGFNTYSIGNFCIPNSFIEAQPITGNIGSCTNNDFIGIPEWNQVIVPDAGRVIIKFPSDLFAYSSAMEGEVILFDIVSASSRYCDSEDATTLIPTMDPTFNPTFSRNPTIDPTSIPTNEPTMEPTAVPTLEPTIEPTSIPTIPTIEPTMPPTSEPTIEPTINDGAGEDAEDLTIYLGIGFGVLFCCCLCVLIYIICTDKKEVEPEPECEAEKRMGNTTMVDIIDNHVTSFNIKNYRNNTTEISLATTVLHESNNKKEEYYKRVETTETEITMIELNDNKKKAKKISAPKKNKKMGNATMMDIIDAVKDGDDMTTKTGKTTKMLSDDIKIIMEDKEMEQKENDYDRDRHKNKSSMHGRTMVVTQQNKLDDIDKMIQDEDEGSDTEEYNDDDKVKLNTDNKSKTYSNNYMKSQLNYGYSVDSTKL